MYFVSNVKCKFNHRKFYRYHELLSWHFFHETSSGEQAAAVFVGALGPKVAAAHSES